MPPLLRPPLLLKRPLSSPHLLHRRFFTVLGIETSCDDTSVALLHLPPSSPPKLLYHRTITSPNRIYGGIHPYISLESHRRHLAPLLSECLSAHPNHKPDLVAATRGPGMVSSLAVGLDTGKGLALAWGVPFVGVHHMQAHLLTPRLTSQLSSEAPLDSTLKPEFPFLTLLVSGGHTMLLKSTSLTQHSLLANTLDVAVGDYIDKAARAVLPESIISAGEKDAIVYGRLLEKFAFPGGQGDYDYHPTGTKERKEQKRGLVEKGYDEWKLNPPLSKPASAENNQRFSFAGLGTMVDRAAARYSQNELDHRRALGVEAQRVVFEHLASRITYALDTMPVEERKEVKTIVVSGGVASNEYLRHVLRRWLESRGYEGVEVVAPPARFCTDNAAMIAWAGWEMWREGWRSGWGVEPVHRWGLDERVGDKGGKVKEGNRAEVEGGVLAAGGWEKWRE